ncbi:MAG: porphobilinogen synthase [Candidatus Omnitrophica bacterium]|nr:porphobilinogen synthase [Candidatus Omnitrophota bacterium]
MAGFPRYRPRRLRQHPGLRRLIAETALDAGRIVAPLFVSAGVKKRSPVASMPGVERLSVAETVAEAKQIAKLGLGGILIFGIPAKKDPYGKGAYAADGIVQQAVNAVKRAVPGLVVMTDVCLCEYTTHGHCGVTRGQAVDNDATLRLLAETAVSQAKAGADLVAPSAMMDGQVAAIRRALDDNGLERVPIMGYSAKYASALYGPFRDAAQSTPQSGDRRGYQMDPANAEEALREVALDIEEGADIVMVKPAITSLDVIRAVKRKFRWPTAAYQVSGEYSLVKAAAARGWVDERRVVLEMATAIRRAGADILITYHAKEIAGWLERG